MEYITNYCIYVWAYHHPEVDRICFKKQVVSEDDVWMCSVCVYIYIVL